MSAWVDFAVKHYEKNKHIKGYTYAKALKEAGKLYKKGDSSASTMKKSISKDKKSKKSKTARRSRSRR